MNTHQGEGLQDVVAGHTSISTVGKVGVGLTYRGYSIEQLATESTFEEVAFLLLEGELPKEDELQGFKKTLRENQCIPKEICAILECLPKTAHPMDVLRTACSALGSIEPEKDLNEGKKIAKRLMPFCISSLMYWHHFHQGKKIDTQTEYDTLAGQFLNLLTQQPLDNEQARRACDVSFILYAEHEYNASTFCTRVSTATLTDFYSGICAGIGTLRGILHGGANEKSMELIQSFKSTQEAVQEISQKIENHQKVMGFGHRVYKSLDPRSAIIQGWAEKLATNEEERHYLNIANAISTVMKEKKNLFPNVDFYTALVYHALGLPIPFYTPMFVFARLSGWSAHILEQRQDNRLIRPSAEYIGSAPRAYVPLSQR